MALRMAKLTRTKTGLWTARKVIPADVRAAYGKREEKPTWPASLTPAQARAEYGVWLAGIEDKIAALRSSGTGPAVELTQRQSRALAGKWYRSLEQRFSDNPGDELGWEVGLEALYPEETEESYLATQRGSREPYEGPWRITPMLLKEMQWLLDDEGLRITPSASDRLLQDMADLYIAFSHLMIRRCRGDYGADIRSIIFPRYHQLDVTRKLQAKILEEGVGEKYLVQHSAGSGKTNSIAWTAHFLSELHDPNDQKLFSTIIVVSDRRVIDGQLQDALFDFQRTTGVVETIKSDSGSKSGQLAEALKAGKKIIVCTIQTFPYALQAVRDLAATEGKRFAVIADEAHSSQTGEAAAKLKEVLSPEEIAELQDGGEIDTEDLLAAQMAARASDSGVTYVAFTATPKAKTLQLFGRPKEPGGLPAPFHVYSMRQAIEEGFILDVLKNYTPYKLAFKLAHNGKELEDAEVERSAATRGIMQWVSLHPYNIAQKVQIVVEHFRENVEPLLDGKAKAMVVLGSRKEAVRWKLAIDKYIRGKGYPLGTLVAFSGEVNDPESSPDPLSEASKELSPNLKGRDIRDAFKAEEYHLLLVANKFQTGFDQPLLCGMYVDRRLAGVHGSADGRRRRHGGNPPSGRRAPP